MWSEICVSGWHKESENPNFHWRQIRILIPKWILYIVLTRLTDARFMTIKDQWIPASRRVRKVDNTEATRWKPWFWPRARRVGLTRNGFNPFVSRPNTHQIYWTSFFVRLWKLVVLSVKYKCPKIKAQKSVAFARCMTEISKIGVQRM